jgi:hypothetical protein
MTTPDTVSGLSMRCLANAWRTRSQEHFAAANDQMKSDDERRLLNHGAMCYLERLLPA